MEDFYLCKLIIPISKYFECACQKIMVSVINFCNTRSVLLKNK